MRRGRGEAGGLSLAQMVHDSDWVVLARIDKITRTRFGGEHIRAEFAVKRQIKGDFALKGGSIVHEYQRSHPGADEIGFNRVAELRRGGEYLLFLRARGKFAKDNARGLIFQMRFDAYDLARGEGSRLHPSLRRCRGVEEAASTIEKMLESGGEPYIGGLVKRLFAVSHIVILGSVAKEGEYDVGYSKHRFVMRVEVLFKRTATTLPPGPEFVILRQPRRLQEAVSTRISGGERMIAFLSSSGDTASVHPHMSERPIWRVREGAETERLDKPMLGYGTDALELVRALKYLKDSTLASMKLTLGVSPPPSMFGAAGEGVRRH